MVGVNYVAGTLNRAKKKAPPYASGSGTSKPDAPRPRGRPLFSRPPPIAVPRQDRRYIDTANYHPSPASSSPNDAPRSERNIDAYAAPNAPLELLRAQRPTAGRSGIDGITFPWAIEAREVYLEERRVEEYRRQVNAAQRLDEDDDEEEEEDEQREVRRMEMRVLRAKMAKEQEIQRGKRRWWEVSRDSGGNESGNVRQREGRTRDACSAARRRQGLDDEDESSSGSARHRRRAERLPEPGRAETVADFERERRIFVDMLHNHDLLHLRDLRRPIPPEGNATPSGNSNSPNSPNR
ncbi:uncharacterized protein MKK02DRAFT_43313 [Dioszegia hungarica]|uniref:Uncharacterized protein n=1 Tax=Dioszegia hungarica TaxID=4972 RepID=A0AA38HEI5_9TREE|nr:uncharacterized protein MKK02DRAFT_43313 [Dioszegia hungarica]KAI9637389.1 hypothetical protein MKK02DRAFT_43313 [Dioszegia hungarica]